MNRRISLRYAFILGALLVLGVVLAGCALGPKSIPLSPTPSSTPPPTFVPPTKAASPTPSPKAHRVTPTSSPVASPTPAMGRISGIVWEDECPIAASGTQTPQPPKQCVALPNGGYVGDGKRESNEPLIAGVRVSLAKGDCPGQAISVTATDSEGKFVFSGLKPGKYCVSVNAKDPVNAFLLNPGAWTVPLTGSKSVTVKAGEEVVLAFGRTITAPKVAQVTPTPVLSTATPLPTATPTPTFTPTPVPDDLKPYTLGDPDMQDPMDAPSRHWYLFPPVPQMQFQTVPGKLVIKLDGANPNVNYWVNSDYPALQDAYIEARFVTGPECSNKDRYGLVVRKPDRYEGIMFLVSCDAMFKIVRWDGGVKVLAGWTHAPVVHIGPNQINRIGVWMQGNDLLMYINRSLVAKVHEDIFTQGGFGLAVGVGPGKHFQVAVDEVDYWILP